MGRVWREEEHVSFVYWDVDEFYGGACGGRTVWGGWLDGFEEHGAFVLVEVFWGCVYVVICSGVWAAHDLGEVLGLLGLGLG